MQFLSTLTLRTFRNHERSTVSFEEGINIVFGPNGAGKTNLLEAIHYLCLGQSFLASSDRFAVRDGADFFDLDASFSSSDGTTSLRLTCMPGEGKRFFVNGAPLDRLTDILGRFPCVVHSHEDHTLTAGPPDERRRFVDRTLCQFRPVYTDNLIRFRRALKQRNAVLQAIRYRGAPAHLLDTWNHELISRGAAVASERRTFTLEFERYLLEAYQRLAVVQELPSVSYKPGGAGEASTAAEFADVYTAAIEEHRRRELESARSLVGPHRDELLFTLDGRELRRYASQGQHRTFGMSLKLAVLRYLSERCRNTPILLLDDAFAHLDLERQAAFAEMFSEPDFSQTIMTSATSQPIAGLVADHTRRMPRLVRILEGRVVDDSGNADPVVNNGNGTIGEMVDDGNGTVDTSSDTPLSWNAASEPHTLVDR